MRVPDAAGVDVLAPTGPTLPPAFAAALAEGLAAALREDMVPAQAGEPPRKGAYAVSAAVVEEASGDPDLTRLMLTWTVSTPAGEPLAYLRQPAVLFAHAWNGGDPVQGERIGREARGDVLTIIDSALDRPRAGMVPAVGTTPAVAFRELAGLPDKRAAMLAGAVSIALELRGVIVSDRAGYSVVGQVVDMPAEVSAPPDSVRIKVVWTVLRPDGTAAGNAVQENTLPRKAWEDQFATLATLIADGAAEGVVDVLKRQTMPR